MSLRILIAAGGTGGHVYPALAIAEATMRRFPGASIHFVGSVDGFERPLISESGLQFASYDEVRAGPLHGVTLSRKVISVVNLLLGTLQSFLLMLRRRPSALLLTGGWVGLPVALAARLMRVPILIYLPDIEPGLTIQVLRRFASRIALTVEDSVIFFPGAPTVVTGYPLRGQMLNATRQAALDYFRLDPERRILLVFGGSRGARAINYALLDILPALLAQGLQVIHVTGTLDWPDMIQRRAAIPDSEHYLAFPYLHREMGLAMAAADLAVSRSGASVLGEFPVFGLPSILVPYPYAWRYQRINADYLTVRGAAVMLEEGEMAEGLLPAILRLLKDDARLERMRAAARALAVPDGADRAARALAEMAGRAA